jgi:hypothetical protein
MMPTNDEPLSRNVIANKSHSLLDPKNEPPQILCDLCNPNNHEELKEPKSL